jgi:urease accessory protein
MRFEMRTLGWMTAAVLFSGSAVSAHPQHGGVDSGLMAGFAHPFLGWDHVLAMLAVGLMAAQWGGRAVWALPSSFLAAMLAGGVWGMQGTSFPGVELGLAASVFLLGLAVATGRRYPLFPAVFAIGLFGWFHGHVHGTEAPALAAPMLFAIGFLGATSLLHLAGILLGGLFGSLFGGLFGGGAQGGLRWSNGVRWAGRLIAIAGLGLLITCF